MSNIACDRCEGGWARVGQAGEKLLPLGEQIDAYWTGKDWVCSTCWLKELFP